MFPYKVRFWTETKKKDHRMLDLRFLESKRGSGPCLKVNMCFGDLEGRTPDVNKSERQEVVHHTTFVSS